MLGWREFRMRPSIHDEFLRYPARRGFNVPMARVECGFVQPCERYPGITTVLRAIYEYAGRHFDKYEISEKSINMEIDLQRWHFYYL
jgi:tryptophan 2,3-dioxygenase